MSSFIKNYNSNMIQIWKNSYIDLHETMKLISSKKNGFIQDEKDDSEYMKEVYRSDFNEIVEKEVKKMYLFFVKEEKELYRLINKILHLYFKYGELTPQQIIKEIDNIYKITQLASSLASFVYLNITAISKILENIEKEYKSINFKHDYICENFEKKNSDLLYVLQYKIIDEIGVSCKFLMDALYERFYELYEDKNNIKPQTITDKELLLDDKNDNIDNIDNNDNIINKKDEEIEIGDINEENINVKEKLLSTNVDFEKLEQVLNRKIKNIEDNISNIEIYYEGLDNNYQAWMRIFKYHELSSGATRISFMKSEKTRSAGSSFDLSDSDSSHLKSLSKKGNSMLSCQNYWNIGLILFQCILTNMCITFIYPSIYPALRYDIFFNYPSGEIHSYSSGLIIGITFFGSLLAFPITRVFTVKSFKCPIIILNIISIIANFLFACSFKLDNFIIIIISRLLFGFGNGEWVMKQYIVQFVPKKKIHKYLLAFKLSSLIGLLSGPLLTYCCGFIEFKIGVDNKKYINTFNLSSWIILILLVFLLFFNIFMFSDPLNKNFEVYAEYMSPEEIAKMSDSFNLDDVMTNYANEQLEKVDKQMLNINKDSQFDDTNILQTCIKEQILKELEPYGTVRKGFLIVVLNQFILNCQIMFLIAVSPAYFYMRLEKDKQVAVELRYVSLLYLFCFLAFVPIYFLNIYYFSLKCEKNLYIIGLTSVLILIELVTGFLFNIDSGYYYYIFFCFIFILTYLLLDQYFYFYIKIVPYDFKICKMNGITFIHVIKYISESFGCFLSLLVIVIFENMDKPIEFDTFKTSCKIIRIILYSLTFIIFIIFIYFILLMYRFKECSIRRIMYKKNKRKILRTEF